ncbi:GntR family transcriptional regulator [Hoeflea sp. TYP-13]|uniref:GntR family transcriptional regulator n=1 Tax=Hoeflea sp. TYP-13 TaxID=3230023 RepID=UPI0034C5EA8A
MGKAAVEMNDKQSGGEREPDEQEIVDRIYAAVMEQRLPPKTKLSEAKLCESFGVGRMRIRRALLLLASQGIVDLHSNRGAFVSCPDRREATDVFGARKHLESSIIREVAVNASAKNLDVLRNHVALEDAARQQNERREIIRLSGEFHVKLAEATGNMVLRRVVRELVTRTSLIIGLFGTSGGSSCPDHEHQDILDAIQDKDPDAAEALVRAHLEHIEADLNLATERDSQPDLVSILGL